MPQATILLADDDQDTRALLTKTLENAGHRVVQCDTGEAALAAMEKERFELLVADVRMKPVSGLDLLHHVRQSGLAMNVMVMNPYPTIETAAEAHDGGAFDYLIVPFALPDFLARVQDALEAPAGTVSFAVASIERELERYGWSTRKSR